MRHLQKGFGSAFQLNECIGLMSSFESSVAFGQVFSPIFRSRSLQLMLASDL
jgi:hypothetical protein